MEMEQAKLKRGKTFGRKNTLFTILIMSILLTGAWTVSQATVYNLPERALKEQFKDASIKRKGLYLSRADQKALESQLGFKLGSRFHTFYVASKGKKILGYGIFDTHRVRTKEETLFVVVGPDGCLRHLEVISFFEPREYLAPRRWLKLLEGREKGFTTGVDLPTISGATMTTNAVSRTVKKVMLLQKLHFGK